MPLIQIRNMQKSGLVVDLPSHEIPQAYWTRIENMHQVKGAFKRMNGAEAIYSGLPLGNHITIAYAELEGVGNWLYSDLATWHVLVGSTSSVEITRISGDYTGGVDDKWNSFWLNGTFILNNGVDVPQIWNPIASSQPLVDLPNWTANTTAKVIRGFKNSLIAMDLIVSSNRFPTRVRWSHPADPGQAPSSWDVSDATKLTGEVSLSETPGDIIDGLALRDRFLIYKTDSVYAMQLVGGQSIYRFSQITNAYGLLAQGCVKEYQAGQHVFLTAQGEVIVTNGQTFQDISTGKIEALLRASLHSEYRERAFVSLNKENKEVWVCVPDGGLYCEKAYVWNWESGEWVGEMILAPCLAIAEGRYSEAATSNTWDSDSGAWDADTTSWASRDTSAREEVQAVVYAGTESLQGSGVGPVVLNRGQTLSFPGVNSYSCLLERSGLAVFGSRPDGAPKVDYQRTKLVTEVWPIVETNSSMVLEVYIGAQDTRDGAVTWEGPITFDPATQEKIDCLMEGKYISVRFHSDDEVDWSFHGYGLRVHDVGENF